MEYGMSHDQPQFQPIRGTPSKEGTLIKTLIKASKRGFI